MSDSQPVLTSGSLSSQQKTPPPPRFLKRVCFSPAKIVFAVPSSTEENEIELLDFDWTKIPFPFELELVPALPA